MQPHALVGSQIGGVAFPDRLPSSRLRQEPAEHHDVPRVGQALPTLAVEALRALKLQQARDRAAAGALWQENDLVFSSNVGTQLDHHNVRRGFIKITQAAGVGGDWTPRELRHSFVSLLSDDGMSIERISHLVGHKTTAVTESVYRHPVSIQADHVEPFARLFLSREASQATGHFLIGRKHSTGRGPAW